jgi:hypothetical protein
MDPQPRCAEVPEVAVFAPVLAVSAEWPCVPTGSSRAVGGPFGLPSQSGHHAFSSSKEAA